MNRLPLRLTVACVLLTILAGCWAWRERTEARKAAAGLAAAEARIAVLERKLQAAQASATRDAGVQDDRRAGAVRDDRAQPPRLGRRGEPPPDFSNDPEIAPLVLKQRQRQVASRYAPLFARLGLSPEQAEKLQVLLAEKQISHFDAMGLAWRQGLGRDEAMALGKQTDGEADGAIRTLIGDTAFAQLQEYDHTYAQRTTVNNLATQLCYSGEQLSSTQQEQLIAVLAEHAVVDESAGGAGFSGPGGPDGRMRGVFGRGASAADIQTFIENKVASDAEALQQASAFLTPAQLAAVRQSQEAETEQLRLTALRVDRMRRAISGASR